VDRASTPLAELLRATDKTGAREAQGEGLALYERKENLVGAQRARALFDPTTAKA